VGTSRVYCLCYRSQWCPEYRRDLRWFVRYLEYSREYCRLCSDFQRPAFLKK
jgi:hypothetical protein